MRLWMRAFSLGLMLSLAGAGPALCESPANSYGAWMPYWDCDRALEEAVQFDRHLDRVIPFAAIFDNEDKPLMLEDMMYTAEIVQNAFGGVKDVYLSIVNDVELDIGVYDNKTTALLERLFATEESIDAHIGDIIKLAMRYGVNGIEIDYEAIKKDVPLWEKFSGFIEKLYARCVEEGYKLRVVLGWDSARYAALPEGPDYSVMCYNLFGYHSGPGPKADKDFLQTTYEINLALPGDVEMAYATGGFDWSDTGEITAVMQDEAESILSDNAEGLAELYRDENSKALVAIYTDDEGIGHEMWYADATTLSKWREWAEEYGYRMFALFRLGGNNTENLGRFFK